MSKPMITRGTFADFRLIKTRKLAQIIIELPIEEADAALLMLGGLPRSDKERWVAIALLDNEHVPETKERRAFCDLPMPQQAGIKSNDVTFQLWLSERYYSYGDGVDCATAIRDICGVKSRAEILPGTEAGERWLGLLSEFEGIR